ncbi:uncharacterized protein LOC125739885 [Brienomyrus brachyistius]|uniref:uncharacterized protein LOC125723036 n=1 Tax=Brienomyrus brachyistius TaxID=42636 RepID=UPI0020B2EF28|nr:uncharacterized protein LOC125723036 [Brienomyrus brachyistius]XP_048866377.1 uncharacterized protein LOC125739885 [Brienomyrus brachyistius]
MLSGTDEDYVPNSESESDNGSDISIQLPKEVPADFAVSSDAAATLNAEDPSQEIPEVEKDVPVPASLTMISKNYCFLCGKPQSKIARHLKTHKTHSEIEHAFSFPAHSKERRLLLEKLRNKGNYQHNSDVLMNTTGSLKVRRKPRTGTKEITGKFIHCMYCKGMFVRKELWRHVRRCHCKPQAKDENPGRTKVLGLATHAESAYSQQISSGVWKLLASMKQDEIASTVRNDFCIIQLAQSLYNKHGHDPTKYEYVRQKLREVGRFLLILRKESSIHSMEESVKPANFYRVVQAVKKVSGYDEEKHCYHTPSLALKLGHTLQKISDIIHCRALIAEDGELVKSTEMFKKLYSCKWSELVSHTALNTLNNAKYNKPLTLPFTEDVKLLHRHLQKSANDAICSLKEAATPQSYAELAKVTLSQIIVFNRRRSGEVSKMRIQSFHERDQTDLHEDIAMGLSETEQKLCNYFSRIEFVGKRGRKVAVLLTPIMVDALSLLVSKRPECGVCDTNVFLFARPKSLSYYRGQDCLRIHASRCGAKNPEHLRSTQLRKHVATLSQVLNLKNNELDQLADFLGHDLRVHRDFYRLPVPTTQLAKISKLLLTMEKGQLSSVQGKSLDEIEIDGEIEVSDSELDDKDESEAEDSVSAITQSGITEPMVDASDCDRMTAVPESEMDDHVFCASADIGMDLVSSTNINERPTIPEGSNASKGIDVSKKKKKAWSKAEIAAVMKHFKNHVTRGKLATKNECLQCKLAEHPVLDDRTTQNIRDFVRNRGITLKRQSEKKL